MITKRMFRAGAVFWLIAAAFAGAQQITRVAVVDLQRVLSAIPREAVTMRDFDRAKTEIQAEVDRIGSEIRNLQTLRSQAELAEDRNSVSLLDAQIAGRTAELREYVKLKQPWLDELARKVAATNTMIQSMYRHIQSVAEADGYSVVLNSRQTESSGGSVLWFSPEVDITDKVIKAFTARNP